MVHCGGSPVRGVGKASDRNGVKSPLSVIFLFFEWRSNVGRRNTTMGGGKTIKQCQKKTK